MILKTKLRKNPTLNFLKMILKKKSHKFFHPRDHNKFVTPCHTPPFRLNAVMPAWGRKFGGDTGVVDKLYEVTWGGKSDGLWKKAK